MAFSVKHGPNIRSVGMSGKSVCEVLEAVGDAMNVPAGSEARINNVPASLDSIVPDNCTLEFVKVSGEKGA